MDIFSSHRLRRRTIDLAQEAHMKHRPDNGKVQVRMLDLFERYLDNKPSEKVLDKAQALLQHHVTNRTREEKHQFTGSLFAVCARRNELFAAARPLATFFNLPASLGRDQALGDALHVEVDVDMVALEKGYVEVFQRERVTEAFAFFLAHNLALQDMQDLTAIIDDAKVIALRRKIAELLRETPEAHPIGMDLVGRSVANAPLEYDPAGPLPNIAPDIEAKVRELLKATWSPAVSLPGMGALCHGLQVPDLDLLLTCFGAAPCQRVYQLCEQFVKCLPGVNRVALDFSLGEVLRDMKLTRTHPYPPAPEPDLNESRGTSMR